MATAAQRHDLVVVGASAGGVEALQRFVADLPADLEAAVCVVLHVMPTGASVLPGILARAGELQARHAIDGERLEHGTIYVAPPDAHLIVVDGTLHVAFGPKENGHRPAIDPLFRTAARSHGASVVGVILSGSLDDGTAGLRTVKICGGATLVQDPDEALYGSMPRSAIAHVRPDEVLPVRALAGRVAELVRGAAAPRPNTEETTMAESDPSPSPAVYTCPHCGGALSEIEEDGLVRFRCKVGHAYSQESLLYLQASELEGTLWAALRSLEDRVELTRRVARRMRDRNRENVAERYERQAEDAGEHAEVLRRLLERVEAIAEPDPAAGIAQQGG